MHYLLVIGVLIFLAFMAPLKVTIATILLFLLVCAVVLVTTKAVSGIEPSFSEAARAVGLSLFFVVVVFVLLLSTVFGTRSMTVVSMSLPAAFVGFLVAYVLGFRVALGISIGASAIVAAASAVASMLIFVGLQRLV